MSFGAVLNISHLLFFMEVLKCEKNNKSIFCGVYVGAYYLL